MFNFKKKGTGKKSGFSLIEMVVVVGSFSIIIVAVISTILLTFRSQSRVKVNNKLNENGRNVLAELRRSVFNGDSKSIVCGVGGSSVSISNSITKEETILICSQGNIKANLANLNSNEVTVINCQNFASCTNKTGLDEVAIVEFNFGLTTTNDGVGSTQLFNATVTTRN